MINPNDLGKEDGLKPIWYTELPKWKPRYTDDNGTPVFSRIGRMIKWNDECEKTGRKKSWWTELGYKDDVAEKNMSLLNPRQKVRENMRVFYDPPVPEGTSLAGAFGLDTQYNRDMSSKEAIPGNAEEYRQKLFNSSHQYKQIAKKFDISPEHPGMRASPGMNAVALRKYDDLGSRQGRFWRTYPRFFDKPLNEGCMEKGLAALKLSMALGLINTFNHVKITEDIWPKRYYFKIGTVVKYYLQNNKNLFALSFLWGTSLCLVADARKKDDVYNHAFVAPFTSLCYYALKGSVARSMSLLLVLGIGGTVWHMARCSQAGAIGIVANNYSVNGFRFGPTTWEFLDAAGHADFEKPKY